MDGNSSSGNTTVRKFQQANVAEPGSQRNVAIADIGDTRRTTQIKRDKTGSGHMIKSINSGLLSSTVEFDVELEAMPRTNLGRSASSSMSINNVKSLSTPSAGRRRYSLLLNDTMQIEVEPGGRRPNAAQTTDVEHSASSWQQQQKQQQQRRRRRTRRNRATQVYDDDVTDRDLQQNIETKMNLHNGLKDETRQQRDTLRDHAARVIPIEVGRVCRKFACRVHTYQLSCCLKHH